MRRTRRWGLIGIAPLFAALLLSIAPASGGVGSACRTSSVGSAQVEVCILEPLEGAVLSGNAQVRIVVDVSDGTAIQGVEAALDGHVAITDIEAPYQFLIPTHRYADDDQVRLAVRAFVGTEMFNFPSDRTRVNVSFDNGNVTEPGPTSGFDPPTVEGPVADPVIAASVGDGADGGSDPQRVIDRIATWDPELFLYTGDVYDAGTKEEFTNWYGRQGAAWSRFRSVTAPTIGNHEYATDDGQPYFDYWNGVPHFYAFDAGTWRVIVLDSTKDFGGHLAGTPQFEWLRAELEGNHAACTLISLHHPRFAVGKYTGSAWLQSIWSLAASNGVDIFLTGHDHNYQRWKPLGPDGSRAADGMRQFVAGTGGHELYQIQRTDPRVAFALSSNGALRFELRKGKAWFSFVKPNGNAIDSGKFPCSPPIDAEPPSTPTGTTAELIAADAIEVGWDSSTDDVGVVGYEVFRNGSLLTTTPGDVRSVIDSDIRSGRTYRYRVRAFDATGKRSELSERAVVTTPDLAARDRR